MKKCLIIGALMLDISLNIEHLPERGSDVYIKNEETSIGGCALNVANIISHYSLPFTLFSPIGSGKYADIIQNLLKKLPFTSQLKINSEDNGYCLCLVEPDGERTFLTLAGIECNFKKHWFDMLNPDEYDCAYICGYEIEGSGGNHIIEFLESNRHIKVYYAPGPRFKYIDCAKNNKIFSLNPILHLNEKEAYEYTGENKPGKSMMNLFSKTNNTVIVTAGAKGAYVLDTNKLRLIKGEHVNVVDTIGAGDSHIAAFIANNQLNKTIDESIKFANRVASSVVSIKTALLSKSEFDKIKF